MRVFNVASFFIVTSFRTPLKPNFDTGRPECTLRAASATSRARWS